MGFHKRKTLEDRFWAKVEKAGPDECWLWKGATNRPGGYGCITSGGTRGKMLHAHRVAWLLVHNDIPDGLCVLHLCDNPSCVNPQHLFLGSLRDNSQDARKKGRLAAGLRHGSKTHPEKVRRGESHGNAKLTDNLVRRIRRQHRAGIPQRRLAAVYGVSVMTINGVVHRRKYAHVV